MAITSPFITALQGRNDLNIYNDNAILLYALELRFDIDDIHTVAASALTDGNDDKKCDLVFVDRDNRRAVVAQGYVSQDMNKKEAKANKASDLNTAASWLLAMDLERLPETIKSAAQELRTALHNGEIELMEFWYVHNLPESENVSSELRAVQQTARNALSTLYCSSTCDEVRALEVGINVLNEWYKSILTPILVDQEYTIPIPGGYKIFTDDWEAYATAIPLSWLYDIFQVHKEQLFSANPRGYLGSRRSDRNINNGIKQSAINEPNDFWAFNNGVTALVNDMKVSGRSNKKLRISGISIVNGAQTTGAIGSLSIRPDEKAMVPARFIKSTSQGVVRAIVEYNNSQNKMESADFRSNDRTQNRLRSEFTKYASPVVYSGGKRGGSEDRIERNPNLLPSDTVAQALTAFHGRPLEAYNSKAKIWREDQLYSAIFGDHTTAQHIIFVYSLHSLINRKKTKLMARSRAGESFTSDEIETLAFLRMRGATYLLMAAVSECIETLLDKPVASKFQLQFAGTPTLEECISYWATPLQAILAFSDSLAEPLETGLGKKEVTIRGVSEFSRLVRATRIPNKAVYDEFAKRVEIS